jgi:hypothetical protein
MSARSEAIDEPRSTAGGGVVRWLVPIAILVPWLALITSWQTALFPPSGSTPPPIPWQPVVVAIAAALAIRFVAPSLPTHVLALAVVTMGVSLLAAQVGQPLANAAPGYCGDFCRNAIGFRFIAFFGWPIALSAVLIVSARRTRDGELAAWTRSWSAVTLVAGLIAAVAWWRTILPNGLGRSVPGEAPQRGLDPVFQRSADRRVG